MNKEKAFIVLGGTTNAQINKTLTKTNGNQTSDFWQSVLRESKNICLTSRNQCESTQKLEVFILRNRKTVVCFSICEKCQRDFNKSAKYLRGRLDSVEQTCKQDGKRGAE